MKLVHGLGDVFKHSEDIYWLSIMIYLTLTITLFILMKKYPRYPWVLFACILGVGVGHLQNYLQPSKRMITMGDRY